MAEKDEEKKPSGLRKGLDHPLLIARALASGKIKGFEDLTEEEFELLRNSDDPRAQRLVGSWVRRRVQSVLDSEFADLKRYGMDRS